MPRSSMGLRFKMLLTRHPVLANRLLRLMGRRGLQRVAQRVARRAARRAFTHVPFYQTLYERGGFDARRMRRLSWADFQRLPTSGKTEAAGMPDRQLLDQRVPFPGGDALLGRSSGTTSGPATWPTGWEEFYLTRANYWRLLRELQADRRPAVLLSMFPVDGGDLAGNLPFRSAFSLKETTRWPFEVIPAGEEPNTVIPILRWLVEQDIETLFLNSFPGTVERLLDRDDELKREDPAAGVDWSRFKRIRVGMGGQTVSLELRQRLRRQMGLAPKNLLSEFIVYASSDAGQLIAQSSPFSLWLERYLETRPELAATLGIPEEHRGKPIMECISSMAVYMELDEDGLLLLTTWKHRPLIRYRTNDLAWLRPTREIVRTLNREARGWRRDFRGYGFGRRHVPTAATMGMVLGRADDVRIVNGANVSPEMLRQALEVAGILPQIHHFKHNTDDVHPNEYTVYLEMPDALDELACVALAEQWRGPLLEALVHLPVATDLYAAHRSNPITLRLFVRPRGAEEFAGDDQHAKLTYVPRRPLRRQ
jgi:phenylacetate-coenzyme A ligase PaaK-like adenylate-forming protein